MESDEGSLCKRGWANTPLGCRFNFRIGIVFVPKKERISVGQFVFFFLLGAADLALPGSPNWAISDTQNLILHEWPWKFFLYYIWTFAATRLRKETARKLVFREFENQTMFRYFSICICLIKIKHQYQF